MNCLKKKTIPFIMSAKIIKYLRINLTKKVKDCILMSVKY